MKIKIESHFELFLDDRKIGELTIDQLREIKRNVDRVLGVAPEMPVSYYEWFPATRQRDTFDPIPPGHPIFGGGG